MRNSRTMMKAALSCVLWVSTIIAISASDPYPLQDFCVADLRKANVTANGIECDDLYGAGTPDFMSTGQGNSTNNYGFNVTNNSGFNATAGKVEVNGFVCKDPKTVQASDFFFRGLLNPLSTAGGLGFNVIAGHVENFPAVNTLGISLNRGEFAPGGLNPPHIHPRATEIIFVLEGTVLAGFISTNNRLFSKKLEKGDVYVIPRGLVHFQQNVGESHATTITAFNSQLPGVQVVASALFGANPPLPQDVLTKAFNINEQELLELLPKQSSTSAPAPSYTPMPKQSSAPAPSPSYTSMSY